MSTAMNTVNAAAYPIADRNGIPTTLSAIRAMITVRPANTTAEPAVPTARPAASARSAVTVISWRNRETMNSE